MKVGILTGGGDCPGLNAVIRAVTKSLIGYGQCEVLGIDDGYVSELAALVEAAAVAATSTAAATAAAGD